MSHNDHDEPAKSVVRRNTEEVQGNGDFELFEERFPDDFVDPTPQPDTTPLRSRSWTAVTMIGSVTASSGPRPLASGVHPTRGRRRRPADVGRCGARRGRFDGKTRSARGR